MSSTKIRSAALAALRISLLIFGSGVLMLLLFSAVRRVLDGTWSVAWRPALIVSGILTGLFFTFFFLAQVLEFTGQVHRERDLKFVFPAAMWLRGLYFGSIVMGIWLMAGTYFEGDPWTIFVLPVSFVFLGLFAWPRAIEITESTVRQRRVLFGFKEIRLGEIESTVGDAGSGEIVVFGKNGTRIVHTTMHVDGERFIARLKSVTGKDSYTTGDFIEDREME
jgi:hypothetical protein